MTTIGEALVAGLAMRGVEVVFGIPGVHTIELYRGLAASGLRHVTARHEQGAAFMADGYARATGRPGVAFVVTGPGLTNALTAMAQARADSVPMLVVSGANPEATQGQGLGMLHELPDQGALTATVALVSERVSRAADLGPALARVFAPFASGRPGPTHLEIPYDVARRPYLAAPSDPAGPTATDDPGPGIDAAARRLAAAASPVILAGGGTRRAGHPLRALAEALGAPVVQTVNGRGTLHGHPLVVPASPSLRAVRDLIEAADAVLAVGTEIGGTDYDMYVTGIRARMNGLIRVDLCPERLRHPPAECAVRGDAARVLAALHDRLARPGPAPDGPARAAETRRRAYEEIGPETRHLCALLAAMRGAVPGALMVGDSTAPVYAGNLYHDHDRPGGWFNSATGFGTLGYGIPAAIGAAIGAPGTPVICLVGDGGAQFTLPEMMVAAEEDLPIRFVVWNDRGYGEIAAAMRAAGTPVIGCAPTPPDFAAAAASFGLPHRRIAPEAGALREALAAGAGPSLIEVDTAGLPRTGA